MHRTLSLLIAPPVLLVLAAAAQAQTVGPSDSAGPIQITGNVPNNVCTLGALSDGDNLFDVGVLIDTGTGLLRPDLTAPPKVLTGTQCSSRSQLTIAATAMTAQAFVTTPPTGFSRGVDYTATASGWTPIEASYSTGAAANAAASQVRETAGRADSTISLSGFATAG